MPNIPQRLYINSIIKRGKVGKIKLPNFVYSDFPFRIYKTELELTIFF